MADRVAKSALMNPDTITKFKTRNQLFQVIEATRRRLESMYCAAKCIAGRQIDREIAEIGADIHQGSVVADEEIDNGGNVGLITELEPLGISIQTMQL
jgi:hypothetical protein